MPWNVDFFGVFIPWTVDICGKQTNYFFKGISINDKIGLEILYGIFNFCNKSFFLLTVLDENVFRCLRMFFDNRNSNIYGYMVGRELLI